MANIDSKYSRIEED